MSAQEIADKKFTIALRTLWICIVMLASTAGSVSVAAYRLTEAIKTLQTDHWGVQNQVRFAQIQAIWNSSILVPDPLDIYQGKTSIGPVEGTHSRSADDGRE